MRLIVEPDPESAARRAAVEIASACTAALAARHVALVALSGGRTPGRMIAQLSRRTLAWEDVYVAQVDERAVAPDDQRRNLSPLKSLLVHAGALPRENLLAMPVETPDLALAARQYQALLETVGGVPLRLDVVQLGLGADGHTASLVPGDPVVEVADRDVAVSAEYQGTLRMTLTLPALARARLRLWLVTGSEKQAVLRDLLAGTTDVPANRVARPGTLVIADRASLPDGEPATFRPS